MCHDVDGFFHDDCNGGSGSRNHHHHRTDDNNIHGATAEEYHQDRSGQKLQRQLREAPKPAPATTGNLHYASNHTEKSRTEDCTDSTNCIAYPEGKSHTPGRTRGWTAQKTSHNRTSNCRSQVGYQLQPTELSCINHQSTRKTAGSTG